jgi:hypothetical protein
VPRQTGRSIDRSTVVDLSAVDRRLSSHHLSLSNTREPMVPAIRPVSSYLTLTLPCSLRRRPSPLDVFRGSVSSALHDVKRVVDNDGVLQLRIVPDCVQERPMHVHREQDGVRFLVRRQKVSAVLEQGRAEDESDRERAKEGHAEAHRARPPDRDRGGSDARAGARGAPPACFRRRAGEVRGARQASRGPAPRRLLDQPVG